MLLYLIHHTYIILYYYYIILYPILSYISYYTLPSIPFPLLFSSSLFSSFPILPYSPPPILSSSFLLSPSLIPFLPLSSSHLSSFLSHLLPNLASVLHPLIHSIRVGINITLFIFSPNPTSDNLTPHVLSDGNVEWCSFNVCGVRILGYGCEYRV